MFIQPPGAIPIPLLGDVDGQLYAVSAGVTRIGSIQPTLLSGTYAIGQTIGGLFSITGAARAVANGSGIIYGATIVDPSRNVAPVDLLYFSAAPTISAFVDKTEAVVDQADALKVIGQFRVSNFVIFGTTTGCSVGTGTNQNLQFQLGKTGSTVNTTIFVLPVARGAMTLPNTGWTINFKIMPD